MDARTKNMTTIQITREQKQKLMKMKIHPRQPYAEIINKLLKEHNQPTQVQ